MAPNEFVFWLNGFMELAKPESINERQTQEIKNHLNLVLNKVTPTYVGVCSETPRPPQIVYKGTCPSC